MKQIEKYFTVNALFINYIIQGMAAIIISLQMTPLATQYDSSIKQITLIISAIGLGRILVLYLSGYLSDRFGRKKIIVIGMICYLVFFAGVLLSHSIKAALFFALFAGFANAFLDTGTYPAIAEIFPEHAGSIGVINKAFISIGQFLLPFMITFFDKNNLYFGYSFIVCIVIVLLNLLVIISSKFPQTESYDSLFVEERCQKFKSKPNIRVEGTALFTLGFTIVTIFNIIAWWIPEYGTQVGGMNSESAIKLVSLYSLGSFISVFITASLSRRFKCNTKIILHASIATVLSLLTMILIPNKFTIICGTLGIGIFAAGGIWQLSLAVMLELFPLCKGKVTSIYTLATSISVMIMPYISGIIAEFSIQSLMIFNLIISLISLVCSYIVYKRYQLLRK